MTNIKKVLLATMTAAVIGGCASAVAFAAPEQVKVDVVTNSRSVEDDETSKTIAEVHEQDLLLSAEDAEKYPALAKALDDINTAENDEVNKTFNENLSNAEEAFMACESPELFGTYTDTRKILPQRADAAVVSFLETISTYTGGAHGSEVFSAHNIDPETGKELALVDVVKDEDALRSLVKEELKAKYPDMDWNGENGKLADQALEKPVFTIGNNGLTFWFHDYALGSYAEGRQNVTVPFKGHEDLFNEKFTDVPDCYGFAFDGFETASVDLKGSGKTDKVSFFSEDFDGYMFRKLTVKVNDEAAAVDTAVRNMEGTIVKNGEKTFLYIWSETDNDYKVLDVFDLTGGTPKHVGEFGLSRHENEQLTDPTSFTLDSRTNIIGTLIISGQYTVGEDGTPKAEEDTFLINGDHTITAKRDLALKEVDENGTDKDVTIAAGTELTLFRTDDKTFADAKKADGTIVRIGLNTEGTPRLLDGQNIEDAFDGIYFAG